MTNPFLVEQKKINPQPCAQILEPTLAMLKLVSLHIQGGGVILQDKEARIRDNDHAGRRSVQFLQIIFFVKSMRKGWKLVCKVAKERKEVCS
jgi:hypothetical protein